MRIPAFLLIIILSLTLTTPALAAPLTDDEVRQKMIEESIAAYPGNCPCPYNRMRNGKRCGGWSAYKRKGGYAPLCYPSDITDKMVKEWRERKGE